MYYRIIYTVIILNDVGSSAILFWLITSIQNLIYLL